MKSLLLSLFLWLSGQDKEEIKKEYVSAKDSIVEAYSAKDADVYSAKGAKVPIEMPEPPPDVLNRLYFPVLPPLPPIPPINPPPVTEVNP